MVKSACGIEAVNMCFNRTGIWGGETICSHDNNGNNCGTLTEIELSDIKYKTKKIILN